MIEETYDPALDEIKPPDTPEVKAAQVRPLRDYVVLEPEAMPDRIGEIFLPGTDKLRNKSGGFAKVIRVGPKVEHARIGDRAHLSAYGHHWAGVEIREEGKLLVLIRERDLNGIVCAEA